MAFAAKFENHKLTEACHEQIKSIFKDLDFKPPKKEKKQKEAKEPKTPKSEKSEKKKKEKEPKEDEEDKNKLKEQQD